MEMDSARFVKMCRDSNLLGSRKLSTTDADLIFQKSKKAGNYGKRINFEDFRMISIPLIANKLETTIEQVVSIIVQSSGKRKKDIH